MDGGSRRREIMTGARQSRYVRTSRASFTPFCPCLHSAGSNLNRHRQMDSRNSPVDLRSFRLTRPKRLSPARKWRLLLLSNELPRNARKWIGWMPKATAERIQRILYNASSLAHSLLSSPSETTESPLVNQLNRHIFFGKGVSLFLALLRQPFRLTIFFRPGYILISSIYRHLYHRGNMTSSVFFSILALHFSNLALSRFLPLANIQWVHRRPSASAGGRENTRFWHRK